MNDNPTRRAIALALEDGGRDVRLDTNPALEALGATLIESRPDTLTIGFSAPNWSVQGNGVVGGGTIANMLDTALALAVLARIEPGQTCATIGLTVHMLRPVAVGKIAVEAAVDRLGGRVAFASARLLDAERRLCASAVSSLTIFDANTIGPKPAP